MTERVQSASNTAADAEATPADEEPDAPVPEAPVAAPESGEGETPAAQRRARLRKEIRAGMQRALKH